MTLNPFKAFMRVTGLHMKRGWVIEAEDITGRWGRINKYDLVNGLTRHAVLLHEIPDSGLSFEAVVAVVQKCHENNEWGHERYTRRSKRIRNRFTGDFMPIEVLGLPIRDSFDQAIEDQTTENKKINGMMAAQVAQAVPKRIKVPDRDLEALLRGSK